MYYILYTYILYTYTSENSIIKPTKNQERRGTGGSGDAKEYEGTCMEIAS
jgi:hypothetical protein